MYLCLPSLVALIGAHVTEAIWQERLWTLLRDICIFRKKRTHTSVLVKMLIIIKRVFLVREISGIIRKLASWLPVASKPKGVKKKKGNLYPLISYLKTHTVTKIYK